ncbi:MAG: N-acetylglucosamine-6-phosphate deacetylase [Ignavibacteriales bacterium]|nr:MAG: N-acetylglucosamine-6-phosphate deacetylase [Ignavibacteriales bacterium]
MNESLLIKNCRLYNSLNSNQLKSILIENGKISDIDSTEISESNKTLDIDGKIIAPGLIDVHIQGAGGADILDGTQEALQTISNTLARVGTTSFLGTTVVKPLEENKHLKLANNYIEKDLEGANLLGFHLEGPFINYNKRGGLDPASIYNSSPEKLEEVLQVTNDNLRMMTIAPELPGNLEIIKELRRNNIVPAFAHSEADFEETKKGFDAGINHVTHIFNAMLPLHHRNPGPLAAIFENKEVSAQIISDGHHLHPAIVKILYKFLGADRCICITDGVQAIGLPEGNYVYNGREYTSKNGAARYLDGTLIGSAMSLANIALKFWKFTGCSFDEAINSASKNPAVLLGIYDRKGSIDINKDADLIVFDKDYSIYATIIGGKVVYKK